MATKRKITIYDRVCDAGGCDVGERFKGLNAAKAYQKALRNPFYLAWFYRNVVGQRDFHLINFSAYYALRYGNTYQGVTRNAGRKIVIAGIRTWARENGYRLPAARKSTRKAAK